MRVPGPIPAALQVDPYQTQDVGILQSERRSVAWPDVEIGAE